MALKKIVNAEKLALITFLFLLLQSATLMPPISPIKPIIAIKSMNSGVKGIYLSETTVENTALLEKIIAQAKEVGINTFVADVQYPSNRYAKNIALILANKIQYIARLIVFPGGANPEEINNATLLEKKYQLADYAIGLGAHEVQLDYIRYKASQNPSLQNIEDVNTVIAGFKDRLATKNVRLQTDVFGITSFRPSTVIGQNIRSIANYVNGVVPMLYPSHFNPYQTHSAHPYETITDALTALKKQFNNEIPVNIYAYIETYNYHYPHMSSSERVQYIQKELQAVQDSKINGWYAWSANNRYDYLFEAMKNHVTMSG